MLMNEGTQTCDASIQPRISLAVTGAMPVFNHDFG